MPGVVVELMNFGLYNQLDLITDFFSNFELDQSENPSLQIYDRGA